MDANGQRFWMLSERRHWQLLGTPAGLQYDAGRRALRLASQRSQVSFPAAEAVARARLERVPQTRDAHGNRAWWDDASRAVLSSGPVAEEIVVYRVTGDGPAPTDIAMGFDGVLYIAIGGGIVMHDRRERWPDVTLAQVGFSAWRLAANPRGGAWALDRDNRRLARIEGRPLPDRPATDYDTDVFRPCRENADPPRVTVLNDATWPDDELPVALAGSGDGRLAVLGWDTLGAARLRMLATDGSLTPASELLGVLHPYSLAWAGDERLSVLVAGAREAPTYRATGEPDRRWPIGDLYPVKAGFDGGAFLHTLSYPAHYPTASGSEPLHRLSFPFFARRGEARNDAAFAPLDSGSPQTVWHRLYVEAVIPASCGIRVLLASSNQPEPPADLGDDDWYEHRLGDTFAAEARSDVPRAAWVSSPSEIPFQPGFLPCAAERDRAGLFTVLIQRSTRRVRSLSGRYLHVRVELLGDGRATPEVYALRAYGSRFSYIERYLPRLYRETTFRPEADERGTATRADFLERFVGNMEGVLTTIEDRIGGAYLLSEPATVPEDGLDWLGSWIGFDFDDAVPAERRRRFLDAAPDLYRWHGTLRGLKLALDTATGGGIQSGEIVVLEDFRLRRTFATILGADLADEDDPLTAGTAVSGNSFVGETLFLGDESRKEFLALFAADLVVDTAELAAIDALFDKLANRVTVLVHDSIVPQDLGLVRRIAARETPAHVELRVLTASTPFLVGMASLVGVDSYLARRAPPRTARVGESRLGRGDFVSGPAALDPRIEGTGPGVPRPAELRPVAVAADVRAPFGEAVTLDASESRAFGGRRLVAYRWQLEPGEE